MLTQFNRLYFGGDYLFWIHGHRSGGDFFCSVAIDLTPQ